MSQFRLCPNCNQYHMCTEKCKPEYWYNIPEWGEAWLSVRAMSHSDAAVRACEIDDQGGDHTIIESGGLGLIRIMDVDDKIVSFKINAETVAEYYATEIKDNTE